MPAQNLLTVQPKGATPEKLLYKRENKNPGYLLTRAIT